MGVVCKLYVCNTESNAINHVEQAYRLQTHPLLLNSNCYGWWQCILSPFVTLNQVESRALLLWDSNLNNNMSARNTRCSTERATSTTSSRTPTYFQVSSADLYASLFVLRSGAVYRDQTVLKFTTSPVGNVQYRNFTTFKINVPLVSFYYGSSFQRHLILNSGSRFWGTRLTVY